MNKRFLFLVCAVVFVVCVLLMARKYVKKNQGILDTLETFVDSKRQLYETVKYNNKQTKVDLTKYAQGEESGTLAVLAHNKFSPHCCPSTYTSDRGCACLTEQQKKQFQTRGNNRTGKAYY